MSEQPIVSGRRLRWALGAVLLAATLPARAGLVEDVKRDTEWLCRYASRTPGTEGHRDAQRDLLARVRAVTNAQVWTQDFPVIAPVIRRAVLKVPDGPFAGDQAIYPVWPDLVRLKTTPADGLRGHLIYVAQAQVEDLPARRLRGNIAVMEMAAYENWKQPFSMGASAMLLLGGPDDRAIPPAQQSLYKPRYYVPEGRLADALRRKEIPEATIVCDGGWQTVTGRNIYALVMPAAGAAPLPPIAVVAPYDAMSVVMGLAPGADNAVDAAFLLRMLEQTAAAPTARPVLFCFADAYGFNQLGVRQMLSLFMATPADRTREDYEKMYLDQLQRYEENLSAVHNLGEGAEGFDKLWDKGKYRDLQGYLKDEVGPEMMDLKKVLSILRLERDRAEPDRRPAIQAEIDAKQSQLKFLNDVLESALTRAPLSEPLRPRALAAWQAVCRRVEAQRTALREEQREYWKMDVLRRSINDAMGPAAASNRPAAFLVGLDLSDAGVACGPGLTCNHLTSTETATAGSFLKWLKPILKNANDPFIRDSGPLLEQALSRNAVIGLESPESVSIGRVKAGLVTSPAASFNLSAVTWMTLDADRPRLDTPQDRFDRLDWNRLGPQLSVTAGLLQRLLSDPAFVPDLKDVAVVRTKWRHARGSVVMESLAETIPRTPKPGYLVTLAPWLNAGAGIRCNEFTVTGPDGRFRFPPMPGHGGASRSSAQAFDIRGDGRIVGALVEKSSMIAGRSSSLVDLREGPGASPARVVAFACRELDGPDFFDPRYLEPLSQFSLMDVERGGAPKNYTFSILQGQMCGMLMPGTQWQLTLRAGSGANRMVLMNINPDLVTGKLTLRQAIRTGYDLDTPLPSIPAHLSARDFYTVDEWRADRFSRAGISSAAIRDLHRETAGWLAAADKALAGDDGAALHRTAAAALGTEIRAYDALKAVGDDVTRGAIFLMILLVPFAVAMERLFFAWARIGHRITTSVGIFTVMTMVLWSFHPSFRITTQPLVIIMAFAILLLSLMVITMILRKFGADLEKLRSGLAEGSGAQTGRGGVISSAVWLGIANMRKRKLRTALTGITIVLITFALLCFSSSTSYETKRQFTLTGVQAPYPGVMIRLPRLRIMDDRALPTVVNLLGGDSRSNGVLHVAARYWWTGPNPNWRLHVRHPLTGSQVSLTAGLGLSGGEDRMSDIGRVLKHWDRFALGNGCYLSDDVARKLGVAPGEKVTVAGRDLELIDVFDAKAAEESLKMLDGQSLLPFDFSIETEQRDELKDLEIKAKMVAGIGLEPERDVAFARGKDLVILPAEFTRRIGGTLRSIAVRTDTAANAERTALGLMKVLAFPMYYGGPEAVKVVVSTPLLPRPSRRLFIPVLIAALIIFNTMLNSVAERKSEIHIYTSLGLAPRHVGMLFLSEAVTYGLMGSIFGYIVGQGLATLLTHFDLMGGITLNYSGTNVIMTMSMVLVVVVLSAIVPAIMAGKLATPSKDMRWHVPAPQDGVIRDVLPFTVTKRAAAGLVAFIHEYMDAHREGSIGQFTADNLKVHGPDEGYAAAISGTVWLAPYDLGVRQDFRIEVRPETEEVCGIHIILTHGSGHVKSWWRLNRLFLDAVRRQFLGWRNVKPDTILAYIEKAKREGHG